eukprot:366113-Chlamydomonas_euryale.AAC.6
MDGRTGGWMAKYMDGWIDGWTDSMSLRLTPHAMRPHCMRRKLRRPSPGVPSYPAHVLGQNDVCSRELDVTPIIHASTPGIHGCLPSMGIRDGSGETHI